MNMADYIWTQAHAPVPAKIHIIHADTNQRMEAALLHWNVGTGKMPRTEILMGFGI
jgi:hypothetical protein